MLRWNYLEQYAVRYVSTTHWPYGTSLYKYALDTAFALMSCRYHAHTPGRFRLNCIGVSLGVGSIGLVNELDVKDRLDGHAYNVEHFHGGSSSAIFEKAPDDCCVAICWL